MVYPPPYSQSISLHVTFQIATPGAFVQPVCLALWAVRLILPHSCSVCFFGGVRLLDRGRSAQRASVAREWSSFLAWPCGSKAICSVSVPPSTSIQ